MPERASADQRELGSVLVEAVGEAQRESDAPGLSGHVGAGCKKPGGPPTVPLPDPPCDAGWRA